MSTMMKISCLILKNNYSKFSYICHLFETNYSSKINDMNKNYIIIFIALTFSSLHAQITFTDVTSSANMAFNAPVVESLAWGDYDNDGDEDLFLTTNGSDILMRNDGNDVFTDVSTAVGLTEVYGTTGCVFGDLDNDGDLDIFIVSSTGSSPNFDPDVLYENLGASSGYTFQSVSSSFSGLSKGESNRGVALFDYNRDGLLDIYVNASGSDLVYKNLGGLKFEEVATSIGINFDASNVGVGVVPVDINADGWIDLFTGNRSSDPNKLFLNDGTGNFNDITTSAGITALGLGMGVLAFDYDNDLDMDLYWTTWPGSSGPLVPNAFYQNQGNNTFTDVTISTTTEDLTGWGISCNAGDIDNDSFVDFFITNGFSQTSSQSLLMVNNNGSSFSDVTTAVLGDLTYDARGVAFADYDNDGDMDVCLTGGAGFDTKLWRNDTANSNNWVVFKLEGTVSNKNAIGARIEVTAGGVKTVKEVSGGAGRGSFNSLPVEFGLGGATSIEKVKVTWPNGTVEESSSGITINQYNTIIEGTTLSVSDNVLNSSLKIFPNPFKKDIMVDLGAMLTTDITSIKIYDTIGKLIYSSKTFSDSKIITINMTTNYKGVFYLVVESDKYSSLIKKIVKY